MKSNMLVAFAATLIALGTLGSAGFACAASDAGETPRAAKGRAASPPAVHEGEKEEGAAEPQRRSEEEKETAEEMRMRKRGVKQAAKYRAASCAEAIAKIEALLQKGKGRWDERNAGGHIPGDLIHALVRAEMWAVQSAPECSHDPKKPRFDALRSLIVVIWQYPKGISHETLEKHLRVLDE